MTQTKSLYYPAWALLLSLLFILLNGYQFNTGDQGEHLPQVYRLFDPELYQGDFFLQQYDQTFSIREFYIRLVYAVAWLIGVPAACFLLHLACIFFSILGWMRIASSLSNEPLTPYLAPLLICFVFQTWTVGGNTLLGNLFVGSTLSEPFAIWGIFHFVNQRQKTSLLLMGIASWFQLLIGLQWMLILLAIGLFSLRHPTDILKLIIHTLVYLCAASPMLVPIVMHQLAGGPDNPDFYTLLYHVRAPWHYLPSTFPTSDYIQFIALLIAGVWLMVREKQKPLASFSFQVTLFVIGGCAAYSLLLEGFDILAVGKLQWFKTTVWVTALIALLIADQVACRIRHKRPQPINIGWFVPGAFMLSGFLLLMLLNTAWLSVEGTQGRWQVGNYPQTDLQRMHEWIRTHTPKNARFLVSPYNESFACEAQRPMPVNYKSVIHEPFFFAAWKKSLAAWYQLDETTLHEPDCKAVAESHFQTLPVYAPDNGLYYRIDNLKQNTCINDSTTWLHREGNWVLTRIPFRNRNAERILLQQSDGSR